MERWDVPVQGARICETTAGLPRATADWCRRRYGWHVSPERVGNRRHIVVSELAGRGNVRMRSNELGVDVQGNERVLLEKVKELESQGYQFEAAEGSFELLGRRNAPGYRAPFEVLDVVVISERRRGNSMFAEATAGSISSILALSQMKPDCIISSV